MTRSVCPGCAHEQACGHAEVHACANREPIGRRCCNCRHCCLVGYDPAKEVCTVSYWCEAKGRHTSPDKECGDWAAEGGRR